MCLLVHTQGEVVQINSGVHGFNRESLRDSVSISRLKDACYPLILRRSSLGGEGGREGDLLLTD
ncbi:hypothetical protein N665_0231s0035 [Sinapis alba]|nr:hypothetical protein N665_0231s0035 [Sinapis alba]KAF8100097.1 hypothetical protein N665_0231s0035 [Sinapis alba]